ncbi:MAG: DUF1295 domain-containing protein [Halorhodospira sp.]
MVEAAGIGLVAVLALMTAVWVASLATDDASLVDRFWGAGFILAALAYQAAAGAPAHGWLVVALVALWGARLSLYLTWRSWGAGEDRRYRALRTAAGPSFRYRSLVTVFGLQGVLLWLVSAPLLVAIAQPEPQGWAWHPVTLLGMAVFLLGGLYEAIADAQLARFRAEPANRGRVCRQGLWRYSRHPNYFGEIVLWWGLWLMAVPASGWWTVFAPLLVTGSLLRVTGVPLLEQDLAQRRPDYADYQAQVPAVVPSLLGGRPR